MISAVKKIEENNNTESTCRINISNLVGSKKEVYNPAPDNDETTTETKAKKQCKTSSKKTATKAKKTTKKSTSKKSTSKKTK